MDTEYSNQVHLHISLGNAVKVIDFLIHATCARRPKNLNFDLTQYVYFREILVIPMRILYTHGSIASLSPAERVRL